MSRRPRVPRVTPAPGRAADTATPSAEASPAGTTPADVPPTAAPKEPSGDAGAQRPSTSSTSSASDETPTGSSSASGPAAEAEQDPAERRRARAASIAQEPGGTVLRLPNRHERRTAGASRASSATDTGPADSTAARPAAPSRTSRRTGLRGTGRFANRPEGAAARRRHAARAEQTRRQAPPTPVPARALTGRSLLVIAVVLLAAVLVAPSLRIFLNQELEMNAVRADIAEQERQRDAHEERIRRWDDPEFVEQQARDRLELVTPGETLYTVTGTDELPESADEPETVTEKPVNDRLPWAEGLWDSVVRAGTE